MKSGVSDKLDAFFSRYAVRNYPKGQILVHSGDEPAFIFYLVSGRVRQYNVSFRGDEVVLNVFKPGAFFPMLPVLSKRPNQYFFETETETQAYLAPPGDTIAFLKDNPDVLLDLLARVYSGMDGVLGRMYHLMSGSAKSRILYELLIECRRFGVKNKEGGYTIAINEGDLAGRAGLTRETVSREVRKLGQDGLIIAGRKGIAISDIDLLEQKLSAEV